MLRQVVVVVLAMSVSLVVAARIDLPVRAQEADIYINRSSGTVEDQFVFTGSGFEPGANINVSFITPQRGTFELASNPLIVEDDGTFRLTIVPMNDLTDDPGNPHSVQTGRWIATFTLSAETYYQQEFEVDR
jgi:hypothetical protein